jgi:flagellar motility protein MotE (MotC chaperone)
MMHYIRDLRLIPIALIASACLLVLKIADLALHSSYSSTRNAMAAADTEVSVIRLAPDATQPPGVVLSWAQQMFNFPDGSGAPPVPRRESAPRIAERDLPDITGSVDAETAKSNNAKAAEAKNDTRNVPALPPRNDGKTAPPANVAPIAADGSPLQTGAERAILERLQERRQELDSRSRELDIRESLIQGAEKRMDAKLVEIKEIEGRIKIETGQQEEAEAGRLKGLVTMYETMKPRDAAKIFDRLDSAVLMQVASLISPRKMSDILALMTPDVAEKLTVELASKAHQAKPDGGGALPKIQGQPTAH